MVVCVCVFVCVFACVCVCVCVFVSGCLWLLMVNHSKRIIIVREADLSKKCSFIFVCKKCVFVSR